MKKTSIKKYWTNFHDKCPHRNFSTKFHSLCSSNDGFANFMVRATANGDWGRGMSVLKSSHVGLPCPATWRHPPPLNPSSWHNLIICVIIPSLEIAASRVAQLGCMLCWFRSYQHELDAGRLPFCSTAGRHWKEIDLTSGSFPFCWLERNLYCIIEDFDAQHSSQENTNTMWPISQSISQSINQTIN